jgi:AcrR family transcriptional regulator
MPTSSASEPAPLWAAVQPETSRRLLLAALDSFATRGFHATTTRDIAQRAGMSPAAVYVHYRSKTELLHQITRTGHEAILLELEQAVDGVETATERLRRFVVVFATWHARNHTLARVMQNELGALPEREFREIGELRARFEALVEAELRRGQEAGELDVPDVARTAVAVLSLCIDVARWYTPRRGQRPEDVAALYAELVLRMVGARR